MRDLDKKVDAYVCRPMVSITTTRKTIFVEFERLDTDTMEGSGMSLELGLSTEEAMRLMKTLEHMQERYDLPVPEDRIVETPASPKPN
jgi:hypothetical protein